MVGHLVVHDLPQIALVHGLPALLTDVKVLSFTDGQTPGPTPLDGSRLDAVREASRKSFVVFLRHTGVHALLSALRAADVLPIGADQFVRENPVSAVRAGTGQVELLRV